MTWTKKHDKFALSVNLSESRKLILRDILRKGKLNEPTEVEVDLRVTNQWVGKCRLQGLFHRKTMTTAIPDLEEKTMGMIVVLKRYSPWVYKLLVRPLSFVERMQSAKCALAPKPTTANSMFSEQHKRKSREQLLQNISRLNSYLSKLGLNYTPDALNRLWRFSNRSMAEVKGAVEYMLKTHAEKIKNGEAALPDADAGIRRPKGWLHDCLKYGWHINDKDVVLPFFDSISALADHVNGAFRPNDDYLVSFQT